MRTDLAGGRLDGRPAVEAEQVRKRFGTAGVQALAGVDLVVPPGTVCGLLGPNGAGKTTMVRVLTTLLKPDTGRVRVAGVDVLDDPALARTRIGLAGQYAAVDELLTGHANLVMVGELYHLPRRVARARAGELLERFALAEVGARMAKTYSGGMRRRLDLAAALVVRPPVLFLDEPTMGLDPASRIALWELLQQLVADGTTLLLTTQYLDEADRLADRIVVIDHGRVIAEGTPLELKQRTGGRRVEVVLLTGHDVTRAAGVLRRLDPDGPAPEVDTAALRVAVAAPTGPRTLMDVVRLLDAAGIEVADVALRQASLDEVFLDLTGRRASAADGHRPAAATAARP